MRHIQSNAFQQALLAVVTITLTSGAACLWLAEKGELSPQQSRIFETCNTTWNLGVTTVVGLLGVRSLSSLSEEEDRDRKDGEEN